MAIVDDSDKISSRSRSAAGRSSLSRASSSGRAARACLPEYTLFCAEFVQHALPIRSSHGPTTSRSSLRQGLEGLALKKLPMSAASIHRQIVTLAEWLGEPPPSYGTAYAMIREPDPGLAITDQDHRAPNPEASRAVRSFSTHRTWRPRKRDRSAFDSLG
jgi:hypothetical protein